jgi:hypothetical protein
LQENSEHMFPWGKLIVPRGNWFFPRRTINVLREKEFKLLKERLKTFFPSQGNYHVPRKKIK